jgi:hypothetical protein
LKIFTVLTHLLGVLRIGITNTHTIEIGRNRALGEARWTLSVRHLLLGTLRFKCEALCALDTISPIDCIVETFPRLIIWSSCLMTRDIDTAFYSDFSGSVSNCLRFPILHISNVIWLNQVGEGARRHLLLKSLHGIMCLLMLPTILLESTSRCGYFIRALSSTFFEPKTAGLNLKTDFIIL